MQIYILWKFLERLRHPFKIFHFCQSGAPGINKRKKKSNSLQMLSLALYSTTMFQALTWTLIISPATL